MMQKVTPSKNLSTAQTVNQFKMPMAMLKFMLNMVKVEKSQGYHSSVLMVNLCYFRILFLKNDWSMMQKGMLSKNRFSV